MSYIIAWVLFGVILGIVAFINEGKTYGGFFSTIILAVIGSISGGLLGNLIFGVTKAGLTSSSMIVALVGVLIVLWIKKAFY